jgi:hypothetical protein
VKSDDFLEGLRGQAIKGFAREKIMLVLAVLTDPGTHCLAIGQRCGFGGAHWNHVGWFGGGAAHVEPYLLSLCLLLTSL